MHQHHHDSSAATEATANDVPLSHLSIPDVVLLNQRGERVHFYTDLVKGKVVAINFIFTTCTTICPPMGANFSKLQQLMSNHVGRDFNLLSISVDPVTDTPPRLKAWSEKFAAGPGWTLLTGPKSDVDYLLKALKVFTPDKWDHSPIVLVGNEATGQWTRVYGLAPPTKLAEMVTGLIDSTAKRSSPKETSQ
jgi:cytochrome oxidase Cu insertion factor (SCO1/SenC/PrrC family)